MRQGRHICNTLKDIRRKIADANDIVYEPRECHHEGECAGTCPACEAEVRYIEDELNKRKSMGKKVAVASIAVGLVSLAGCGIGRIIQPPLAGIPVMPDPQPMQDTDSVAASQGKDEIEPQPMGKPSVEICTDTLRPLKAEEKVLEGVVEQAPQFRGGDQALQEYLKTNMRYPDEDVVGRVVVSFTVLKDGTVSDAKVVKSLSEGSDKEALRLVNAMPKWSPGKQYGQVVETKMTIPVIFRLE